MDVHQRANLPDLILIAVAHQDRAALGDGGDDLKCEFGPAIVTKGAPPNSSLKQTRISLRSTRAA